MQDSFALRIHSEATRPIVPEDNSDLNGSTADPQAPYQLQGSLSHRPTPQQLEELQLVNKNLLRISNFNGQAVGRNLAALVAARRQLWLSQARIADGDKAQLLDSPITSGHTFGPAVDDMLQRSHQALESTKDLVHLLPKRPPPVHTQPAPAKVKGDFHNRPAAVQRGNFNKFHRQAQRQTPQAKAAASAICCHRPRAPFQAVTWSNGINAPWTSGCSILYIPVSLQFKHSAPPFRGRDYSVGHGPIFTTRF
ncbi:UNVERIFIED_CONTAM: hypothetical protein FKN15_007575 [Acipenser sinensis]